MTRLRKWFGGVVATAGAVVVASPAFAAPAAFFEVPTVSVDLLGTMITGILAALALLWGARKAIKSINRS